MLAAEPVQPPENGADAVERGQPVELRNISVQKAETLFGEREKDVVFRREVAVNCGGAVLDPLRDLANRDVLISLADEKLTRSVENGAPDRFPVPLLSFFDTQGSRPPAL